MKNAVSPAPLTRIALLASLLLSSCAFHSTATRWNGLVGPNGDPVFVKSTSSVGVNFLVIFKLFGATTTSSLIDELTEDVAVEGGDRVRIIQSDSENYWYGFPPFTWIITPVTTTVTADYVPSEEALAEARAEDAKRAAKKAGKDAPEAEGAQGAQDARATTDDPEGELRTDAE